MAADGPVTVPVTLAGRIGGPHGVAPVVHVRIDGGRPLAVLLDTGSTGLRVLARSLPAAARRAAVSHDTRTWATGAVTTERLLKAQVAIGGLRTTHAVNVGVVDSVTCPGSTCTGWPSTVPGIVGTLGISLHSDAVTENPLRALAGGGARSWRVTLAGAHTGLELRAPIPADPAATFVAGPGAATPTACWQIGRRSRSTCLPTLFDTGTSSVIGMNMAGARSSARLVDPGIRITVRAGARSSRPFWSFVSGSTSGRNLVGISSTPLAVMVSGMPTFSAFALTFDAVRDRELLTRLTRR